MKTIGFIGVGIMGRAMVRNLMQTGFDVTVYTRTEEKAAALIQEGAHWAPSVAECVREKDAVITMVGYPSDVEEVYFGPAGVLENAKPGAIIIDATTSQPDLAIRIFAEAKAKGLHTLDAPVTGGEVGAISATLVVMVGGEREVFEQAMPIFDAIGSSIHYHGSAGMGQHCKMANQIGIASNIAGICEVFAYARAVGLDPENVLHTIKGGSAGSVQMSLLGTKMLAEDDKPAFYLKHFLKDLKITLEEAEKRGQNLPQTKSVTAAYQGLEDRGFGDSGTQALRHHYE